MKITRKKQRRSFIPTPPTKSLQLSSVRVDNKTIRRSKNKVRKLISILFPLALLCAIMSAIFVYQVINALQQPAYISPLSTLGIQAIRSTDDVKKQELEKILKEHKITYQKITRGMDSSYIIYFTEEKRAIISLEKDLNLQISSLQFILSRLTMESREFKSLDLRFDKPIILFE